VRAVQTVLSVSYVVADGGFSCMRRYLRNAGLLRELFSEEARPLGALLDASSGEAAVAVARARLEELQRAPLVTDDNLLQIAAAMAATQQRYLTMGTFMRSAETSRSLREVRVQLATLPLVCPSTVFPARPALTRPRAPRSWCITWMCWRGRRGGASRYAEVCANTPNARCSSLAPSPQSCRAR